MTAITNFDQSDDDESLYALGASSSDLRDPLECESRFPAITVENRFNVIGFHRVDEELLVARTLEHGVDYQIVEGNGKKWKRVCPLTVEPMLLIDARSKVSFFDGKSWKDATLSDIDTSDPVKVRLFISGQFFPARTSRGNIVWPVSTIVYDVYDNPDFYKINNVKVNPVLTVEIPVFA